MSVAFAVRARLRRWSVLIVLAAATLGLGRAGWAQDHPREQAQQDNAVRDTPELHLARGHDDLKYNRYHAAALEFRAALALDPSLVVRARFPLAVALFNLQDRDNARKEFEAVRSQTGDGPNVMYYLGRLDLMEGKVDEAIRKLTIAASDPPFPDTPYYLGFAYFKKRDLTDAEQWLRKAAKLAPRDYRVQQRLALLYQAAGRKEEAEKAFAESSELHKHDVQATEEALACGHSLDTQPLDQSRPTCEKLFDPEDVSKLVTLGTLYGEHRYYAEALDAFRRASELEPDSYEMQYNLGLTYFRLKRYAEARAPLEKAVVLRPDMFEMNAPLGATLYALGDDPAAYRVLSHAHELNPQNAEVAGFLFKVALSLAQSSVRKQDYAGAVGYLRKAADLHPEDPETHLRLADAYSLLGDPSKAEAEREQARRLDHAGH